MQHRCLEEIGSESSPGWNYHQFLLRRWSQSGDVRGSIPFDEECQEYAIQA